MTVVITNKTAREICFIGADFEKYLLAGGISIMARILTGGSKLAS